MGSDRRSGSVRFSSSSMKVNVSSVLWSSFALAMIGSSLSSTEEASAVEESLERFWSQNIRVDDDGKARCLFAVSPR